MEKQGAAELFNRFLNKEIGILYLDTNREQYVRGELILVNSLGIILKKPTGRELFLNFDAIVKIKEVEND